MFMVMIMAVVVLVMAMLVVVVAMMAADNAETKTVVKLLKTVAAKATNDEEANAALEVMAEMLAAA